MGKTFNMVGGGGGSGVSSFNGRTGAVVPAAGDYTAAMVGASPVIGKGVNLLDNWYFANPVNQRGLTTYTGQGIYCIDRWKFANTDVVLAADGLSFVSNGAWFLQLFEDRSVLIGKPLTISFIANGVCYSASGTYDGTNDLYPVFAGAPAYVVISNTYDFLIITTEANVKISAVKLEYGTEQTLARQVNDNWVLNDPPPNYQQELAKCQRYQFDPLKLANATYAHIGIACGNANGKYYVNIPTPVSMRSVGNNSVFNDLYIDGAPVQSVSVICTSGNMVTLECTMAASIEARKMAFAQGYSSSSKCLLDANL